MIDVSKLTARFILAIPENQPERLFSAPANMQAEYRDLQRAWHPDIRKDADAKDVAKHVNVLAAAAKKKITAGSWETPEIIEIKGADGKIRRIGYKKRFTFELGEFAYGLGKAVFLLKNEYADLFESARKIMDFKFETKGVPNDAMRQEMSKYLPAPLRHFETADGRCALILTKSPDVFLLSDVAAALGGSIDPKHVAWIISGLFNIACYLENAGLTHNAISAETVFVSPKMHGVLLLGGWWYAVREGARLNALPALSHRFAPPAMVRSKKGDATLDLTMIRVVGRQLLGDITGMTSAFAKAAPEPMTKFLRQPAGISAKLQYAEWMKVLETSFGPRRFTKLDLSPSDIFGTKG